MSTHSIGRTTRLVAIGGAALGVGFAATSAFAATTTPSPGSATTPTAPAHPKVPGGRHGHFGCPRMAGGGGTVTGVSGSTLTLRTENGSETVTTSATTTYTRERQSIALSDIHVGDAVHVRASTPPSAGSQPGTGTVAASRVELVEPMLQGRVESSSGNTYTLVGRDGQEFAVTVTGGTRYDSAGQSSSRSAISVGTRIVAIGKQDSLTHLNADLVEVMPVRKPSASGTAPSGSPALPGLQSAPAPGGGPGLSPFA